MLLCAAGLLRADVVQSGLSDVNFSGTLGIGDGLGVTTTTLLAISSPIVVAGVSPHGGSRVSRTGVLRKFH
jgi:hypothetical protein